MATQGEIDAQAAVDADEHRYPAPSNNDLKDDRRGYKDEAAASLFIAAGGRYLNSSAAAMSRALVQQAGKLETFSSTPFTKQNIRTIETTLKALQVVQNSLEQWHHLIYPNQKPEK